VNTVTNGQQARGGRYVLRQT